MESRRCGSSGQSSFSLPDICQWLGLVFLLFWLIMLPSSSFAVSPSRNSSSGIVEVTAQGVTPEARQRLLAWQSIIRRYRHTGDLEKLERVNRFLNKIHFAADRVHWGRQDYWATPFELVAGNAGDCEDFAIAKYFSLKAMGVPEARLRMMYVKASQLNQAHMVLAYYASPESDPLILDNLTNSIQPFSRRADLLPVYSFNADSLWLQKSATHSVKVGTADRISLWRDLAARMAAPAAGQPADMLR